MQQHNGAYSILRDGTHANCNKLIPKDDAVVLMGKIFAGHFTDTPQKEKGRGVTARKIGELVART